MDEWRERLAGIDDDYLIGISNKGIVKRAYKDMEEGKSTEGAAEIGALGDEAVVKVGAETVTVRFPLGESKCTCPSRSICRHVVHGILILRERCLADGTDSTGEDVQNLQTADTENAEGTKATADSGSSGPFRPESSLSQESAQKPESSPIEETVQEPEAASDSGSVPGRSGPVKQNQNGDLAAGMPNRHSPVWKEINAYPFEKLQKALGSRYFQAFVNQAAGGIRPAIQESSVVTVQLPEQGMTVKLLSPLEYSTCTCHKKELCRHKAAAILWCQLETGTLTSEALRAEAADAPAYDLEEVRDVAGQMERILEELLGTGLSRVSPDAPDYLERLAVISHNARLSRFEGYFRALADSYGRYFARKAAFRTEDLMEQMTRLYRRAQLLRQAAGEEFSQEAGEKDSPETEQRAAQKTGQEAVGKLAGEFRAGYLPVGDLDLIGIAMEHFRSQTGYEGETVYFLEEKTKQWYTYTNARPVFYDASQKKGAWKNQQAGAPWGLNLSFENLLKVRIHLTGAKCDSRNRLSSSQETKGEVTGEAGLRISDIEKWYYGDFAALFQEQIGKQQRDWLAEQGGPEGPEDSDRQGDVGQEDAGGKGVELVFVQPKACAKAEFSQTEQQLTLPLYDAAGRELLVEVSYSREEAGTIRYLERISGKKPPCFLGKVYLRDGRLRMYPVDLPEIEAPDGGRPPGDGRDVERQTAAGTEESKESDTSAACPDHKSKFLVMEDMADEIRTLMADLCQSGFSTVHDSTLKDLQKSAALTAQYGMQYLSELLAALEENLAANRHRMQQENAPLAGIYTEINEYLYLLRQKNEYSRGESYYT